jgi:hypothetical protein
MLNTIISGVMSKTTLSAALLALSMSALYRYSTGRNLGVK